MRPAPCCWRTRAPARDGATSGRTPPTWDDAPTNIGHRAEQWGGR
jgi:hypothetical protein